MPLDTPFEVGGRRFRSRLMVGTGKYRSNAEMVSAIEASGAEIVTVAVRRVDLDRANEEGVLHHLSAERFFQISIVWLPSSASLDPTFTVLLFLTTQS